MAFASQLPALTYSDTDSFFSVDALYWKVREGSADNWAQAISPAATNQTIQVYGVPFKGSPGLRVGIGCHTLCDAWDGIFSYTWFKTTGRNQVAAESGGIHSPFLGNFFINNTGGSGISGPAYRSAAIQWKVLFQVFDLEAGRPFQIDSFLKLRPFIGLKTGWIKHRIQSSWQTPITPTTFTFATENLKNNFAGVGPSIGLNSSWTLNTIRENAFNLIAQFSGALLWGRWHFKDLYENNTPNSLAVQVSPVTGLAPMTRGLLGIEWQGCVSDINWSVRLGYEAQIWFNQIQYYSLNMGRLNNLMSVQGGVLGVEFYF